LNAATTINSLTINDTSSSGDSLNMGTHGLTVSDASAGGLLYAGNGSGAGSYTINGTADLGAGSGHEFIVNVNTGATLTINTPLIGNNTGYLTTAGGGTLVLTAASTFTSSDYLNAGTVTISADNDLGTNSGAAAVTMNGGTLELASNYGSTLFSNNRGITLGNDGGTINTNSNNVSYGGVITGGTVNTTSAHTAGGFSFTKAGGGTLTLTGANTYGGATIVTGGTLSVNSLNVTEGASGGTASSIGEAPNTEPYLVLNGGNLQYTGGTATTDRQFTLGVNGGGIDNSGSGALNWAGNTGSAGTAVNAVAVSGVGTRTFTLTGSYTSSANTFGMILGDSAAGATSVAKTGAGEWNLTAANTYSGSTTVSAGTLEAGVANALGGTTSVAVNSTGTLLLGASSAINSSATMTLAGGTFNAGGHSQGTAAHGASADSAGLGALTLSANSTLDFGSGSTTSVIAFASAGTFSSNVKLTIDDWNGTYGSADGTSNAGVSEDALYFGTTASLTVAQLADIQFYNGSHDYAAAQASNGEVYASTTVVPEPSTVFAALALFGFVGYRERRRVLLLMHALTKSA
jgi:autotransporter-associated beta strand protein